MRSRLLIPIWQSWLWVNHLASDNKIRKIRSYLATIANQNKHPTMSASKAWRIIIKGQATEKTATQYFCIWTPNWYPTETVKTNMQLTYLVNENKPKKKILANFEDLRWKKNSSMLAIRETGKQTNNHTGGQTRNSFLWKNHRLEIAPNIVVFHRITAIKPKKIRGEKHCICH